MADNDTKQDEIDALRQRLNDEAVRDEEGVKRLKEARGKLKEKSDALEADGSIGGGHLQDVLDLIDESITYFTPFAPAVRGEDGESPDVRQKAVHPDPSGGVTSDPSLGKEAEERNVISHSAVEGLGVNQDQQ